MNQPADTTQSPFFFTWSAQRTARPLHLTGGQGAHFTTADGATWLDLASLCYHVNLGHGHPRMIEAVCRQAQDMCLTAPSAVYPAKDALARRLLELAPEGFSKVFFTLGGAEANENALKIARMVTGRHKLISRYRSYHGATMGALTLSGDWRRPPLEPGIPGVIHALDCYCDRCPFGKTPDACNVECGDHIGQLLDLEGHGSVAAVFLEPVPGANGVLVPPADYWPKVRAHCDRHGTLLVADEVLTGFGRTGTWFGFEHFGAVPDMITVGKALTGGYGTLGAVLVHDRIARHFDDNVLLAGLTHYGHPLGIAAALEALNVYRDEDLIQRAADLGPTLSDALTALQARHPDAIRFTRSIGLLAALELDVPDAVWDALGDAVRARNIYLFLKHRRRMVVLSPPLCISAEDLKRGVALLGDAIAEAKTAAA